MNKLSIFRIFLAALFVSLLGCSDKKPGSVSGVDGVADCNGISGGSAIVDQCGNCVGGSTGVKACVQDCNGEWGGTAVVDACGVCAGGATGVEACPVDCNQVPRGEAYLDECGICVGGDTGRQACVQDCAEVYGGEAYLDECDRCVGGTTEAEPCVEDCAGVLGGEALVDNCDECTGGTTGKTACIRDCLGVWGGEAIHDACGICDADSSNDNQTCTKDCAQVWGGSNQVDYCGICDDNPNNDNQSCQQDCLGLWNGPNVRDDCGVCDSVGANNNSTCQKDCADVWGGGAYVDSCGVCDANPANDNSTCAIAYDCNGQAYNAASEPPVREDDCGVCDADPSNDNATCPVDCAGVYLGPNYRDDCGVCDANQANNNTVLPDGSPCTTDCNGVWAGTASVDPCGECSGGTTNKVACAPDCAGVYEGNAFLDQCDNCAGGTTGRPPCAQDCAGEWGGTSIMVDCNGEQLCKSTDNLFFCDENCSTYLDCSGTCNGSATLDMCGVCDSDNSNNCVPDCAGVPGGDSVYDECGTCDADPSNDCKILAYLPGYGLKDALFIGDMMVDVRLIEVERDSLSEYERCPDDSENPTNRCFQVKVHASNISDPQAPVSLLYSDILIRPMPENGWTAETRPQYLLPNELASTTVGDKDYALFAGMEHQNEVGNIVSGVAFAEVMDPPAGPPFTLPAFSFLRAADVDSSVAENARADIHIHTAPGLDPALRAVSVAGAGRYAYVVYALTKSVLENPSQTPKGMLEVIDLQNYPTVAHVGSLNLPSGVSAWDISIDGNYAYLASGPNGVSVIDISNPAAPAWHSAIPFASGSSFHNTQGSDPITANPAIGYQQLNAESGLLVVTTTLGGEAFDISNIASVARLGDFVATFVDDLDIDQRTVDSEQETYFFVADQAAGLSVVKITEDGPKKIGSLPLTIPAAQCGAPDPTVPGACNTSARRIDIRGDTAYCATNQGLFTVSLGIGD